MTSFIILAFIVGYILIALEHPLRIDKAGTAILTGVICWVFIVIGQDALFGEAAEYDVNEMLLHHVGEIAEILFFLLAAMTIVELIDAHRGFDSITDRIKTTSRVKLLWLLCIITFFFSALLDNLTTAIVMAALLKKLVDDREDVWFMAGMIVIAANAGGAWSPIGDVTTIMLWISERITALNIITELFLPSAVCLLTPLIIASWMISGDVRKPDKLNEHESGDYNLTFFEKNFVLGLGVSGLLFVPIFKQLTHLPPFMGMLFSLGFLWVVTEVMHRDKAVKERNILSVAGVIRRIDTPSILFFLGILLAVTGLQASGVLGNLANYLDQTFSDIYIVTTLVGLFSALVDNVPLVAGAIGMYPLTAYPLDHSFWELLAYCAGTGGSTLIIGSAAGVAIMGILRIDFIWYMKRISLLALAGYFSGIAVYWLLNG